MNIEIEGNRIRLNANGKAIIIHWRDDAGTEIVTFEISDGTFAKSGHLPAVEMSTREVLLRHIGNRLEQL